jgi:hypothetical protein
MDNHRTIGRSTNVCHPDCNLDNHSTNAIRRGPTILGLLDETAQIYAWQRSASKACSLGLSNAMMVRLVVFVLCDGQLVCRADGKALTASNADARRPRWYDDRTV